MLAFNPLRILYDFFYVLIDIGETLYEFLFTQQNILGFKFTPIFVGGAVVIGFMIWRLIH